MSAKAHVTLSLQPNPVGLAHVVARMAFVASTTRLRSLSFVNFGNIQLFLLLVRLPGTRKNKGCMSSSYFSGPMLNQSKDWSWHGPRGLPLLANLGRSKVFRSWSP